MSVSLNLSSHLRRVPRKRGKTPVRGFRKLRPLGRPIRPEARRAVRRAIIDGTTVLIGGERMEVRDRYFAAGNNRAADVVLLRSRAENGCMRTPHVVAMQVRTLEHHLDMIDVERIDA
ncbi:MAG: hypothetical protein ABIV36_17335 [Sphingobium limneticum]